MAGVVLDGLLVGTGVVGGTVEAEGHAEDIVTEVFAAGSDEAGPGAEAGAVDHDVRGFVEDEEVGGLFEDPTL